MSRETFDIGLRGCIPSIQPSFNPANPICCSPFPSLGISCQSPMVVCAKLATRRSVALKTGIPPREPRSEPSTASCREGRILADFFNGQHLIVCPPAEPFLRSAFPFIWQSASHPWNPDVPRVTQVSICDITHIDARGMPRNFCRGQGPKDTQKFPPCVPPRNPLER
jgi:hypothetical protein